MFLHKKLTVDHFIHFLNSFFSLISLPYVIVEIASIDDFLLELSLILKIECYVSCTMSQAVLEMSLSIMSKRETSISNDVISSNHNYCLLNESLLSLKLFILYPRNWRRDWQWLLRKKRSHNCLSRCIFQWCPQMNLMARMTPCPQSILYGGQRNFLLFSMNSTCGIGQICPPNKGDSL